jgi:molybdate transport system substrate-binding protein
MRPRFFSVCLAITLLCINACSGGSQTLTVGVAASLLPPVREAASRFTERTGTPITLVSGSSGALAQQVRSGAPLDAVLLADASFADALAAEGLLVGPTPFATGVLAAVTTLPVPQGTALAALAVDPRVQRIAIATPASAPYGAAAVSALRDAGAWAKAEPRVVYAADVAGALAYVTSSNAELGLVALSLALAADALGLTVLPLGPQPRLVQTAGVVTQTRRAKDARAFLTWITGPDAAGIWEAAGYQPAPPAPLEAR